MTRNALLPYAPCRADLSRRSYNEGGSFSVDGCLQPQAKRSFNPQLAEGYSLRLSPFLNPQFEIISLCSLPSGFYCRVSVSPHHRFLLLPAATCQLCLASNLKARRAAPPISN